MTSGSSLPALRTERLELRQVDEADLGLLIELNSDPAVMAHILGRAATPDETTAEWRQRLDRQSDPSRGLGYWLGFEDGAFVGWWSASYSGPRPEISGIGHRLLTSAWGRGLATEGARRMVEQAFSDPGIDRVFASTKDANLGSRRVLEKVGMATTSTSAVSGVGYELARADWHGLSA